nr:hypothetical protein [Micromonospora sp. DSM 115978]
MIFKNRPAAALAAAVLLLPMLAADPAAAEEHQERPARLSYLRICDPTGCYLAWRVVDSDRDGVCDADELMAGTDPHDPNSRPGLEVIVELASAHKLPSFENGRGSLIAFPEDIIKRRESATNLPSLGVFAPPVRKDTLDRLGVDLGTFEQLKLSVQRDGFAIGLGTVAQGAEGVPARTATPFDGHIVTYEPGVPVSGSPAQYGGIVGWENLWVWDDADYRLHYADKSYDDVTTIPDGSSREHHNADGSLAGRVEHTQVVKDGDHGDRYYTDTTKIYDKDGNLLTEIVSETHVHDGGMDSLTRKMSYIYGPDGKVTGTVVTETVIFESSDGHTSAGETVSECDAGGGNCTDAITITYDSDDDESGTGGEHGDGNGHGDGDGGHDDDSGDDGDDGSDGTDHGDPESDHGSYVNPDYADDGVVFVQTSAGVTRILGGNITVLQNWSPPHVDGTIPDNPKTGIMYVDETAGTYGISFSEPRITTAQPEFVPGMPNPVEGAPPPNPGGCGGLC